MKCPLCKKTVTADHFRCEIARKGGKAGKNKARTSEQARAAVNARWAKAKKQTPEQARAAASVRRANREKL